MSLEGKICVVTGASTGMGRDTARLLAERGGTVILSSRRQDVCTALADEIRDGGGRAAAFAADVTDAEQCMALAAFIERDYGRLDCAFNNAGKILGFGLLHEAEPAGFAEAMAVNAGGAFHTLRSQIPLMIKGGGGSIVINSARSGIKGIPTIGLYSAAKAAAIMLAQVAAAEGGPHGIRVNAIAPGYVGTEAWMAKLGDQAETLAATVPLKRLGTGRDVAATVAFLLSDEATYLTGMVVPIDGGMGVD